MKKIVLTLQSEYDLNDPELAERLGCSAGTVKNVRDEATNLDGVTLANIEYEFGPAALDPFLELGGSRSVPIVSDAPTDVQATLTLSELLHSLIRAEHPDSDGGTDKTHAELVRILPLLIDGRTTLDALIGIAEADHLRVVAA